MDILRKIVCLLLLMIFSCEKSEDQSNKVKTNHVTNAKTVTKKLSSSNSELEPVIMKHIMDSIDLVLRNDPGHYSIMENKQDTTLILSNQKIYQFNDSITVFNCAWDAAPSGTRIYSFGLLNINTNDLKYDIYYQQAEIYVRLDSAILMGNQFSIYGVNDLIQANMDSGKIYSKILK